MNKEQNEHNCIFLPKVAYGKTLKKIQGPYLQTQTGINNRRVDMNYWTKVLKVALRL